MLASLLLSEGNKPQYVSGLWVAETSKSSKPECESNQITSDEDIVYDWLGKFSDVASDV